MLAGRRRARSIRRLRADLTVAGKAVENRARASEHRGDIVHAGTAWEPARAELVTSIRFPPTDDGDRMVVTAPMGPAT
jgi:hypothetical protein